MPNNSENNDQNLDLESYLGLWEEEMWRIVFRDKQVPGRYHERMTRDELSTALCQLTPPPSPFTEAFIDDRIENGRLRETNSGELTPWRVTLMESEKREGIKIQLFHRDIPDPLNRNHD